MSLCLLGVYISLWGFVLFKLKARYHAVIAKRGWPATSSGSDYRWRNVFQPTSTVFWWNTPQWNANGLRCHQRTRTRRACLQSVMPTSRPHSRCGFLAVNGAAYMKQAPVNDQIQTQATREHWWVRVGQTRQHGDSCLAWGSACSQVKKSKLLCAHWVHLKCCLQMFKHSNISHFSQGKMFSLVFCHYNLLERVRECESANAYKTLKRYLIWGTLNFKL